MKTYTLEIYSPCYDGRKKTLMSPDRKVRVHCGGFEENRDFLSPSMIDCKVIEAPRMSAAKARAREYFRAFNFARYTVTGTWNS